MNLDLGGDRFDKFQVAVLRDARPHRALVSIGGDPAQPRSMRDRARYFVRVYKPGNRGPRLVETIAALNADACLATARALAGNDTGTVAIVVMTDDDGERSTTVIGRFGLLVGF